MLIQPWPLDDGRWQLHIPEFYELDFESKIFAKVAEKSDTSPVDDLLDSHSRSFILLASRTLLLDILMLEALLVVDDLPSSNIILFQTEMVESSKLGTIQEPCMGYKTDRCSRRQMEAYARKPLSQHDVNNLA